MSPRPSVVLDIVARLINEPTDECVLAPMKPTVSTGYVPCGFEGKQDLAHRVAYKIAKGPIPAGRQIDHTCHRAGECPGGISCPHRRCINPAHLEAVTGRANTLRGNAPSARNARATTCPEGHPYDEINTYERPDGGRGCRTCRCDAAARYELTRPARRRSA